MVNDSRITEVKSIQKEPGLRRRFFSFKATQIILLMFSTLEVLIALRIMLKLIGSNPGNLLVAVIYSFTSPFLIPFAGLIKSPTINGMMLEISSMVAIVIYALAAVAFEKLIWVIFSRPRTPVTTITETTTSERNTKP
jgi:hypothetical protein